MTKTIDYKKLLKKYVSHVARNEGIDYLRPSDFDEYLFLSSEWFALQDVLEEIDNDKLKGISDG